MQDGCDDIYPAVLTNIIYGRQARRQLDNIESPFLWRMYGPLSQDRNGKQIMDVLLKNDNVFLVSI